jgi:diaminopimelate decarboxylase
MIDTDRMTSLTPQFQDIVQSNAIIVEMGSAFTINATFFASNSHIIIINDAFNYHTCDFPFFQIIRKLMQERNNTIEVFSYGKHRASFQVDITSFKNTIQNYK